MQKRIITLLAFFLCLSATATIWACVGRTLYVGALKTTEDNVMAEMLALLINERTGTTVQTRYFDSNEELYTALKSSVEEKRVDILVEDTADALTIMGKGSVSNPDQDLLLVKDLYAKELNVIWLNPFGYTNSKGEATPSVSAPLVRRDVLTNFPLLPRVLNKLAGAISNSVYQDLTKVVSGGEKPKNAAKDFLRKKKFI